MVQILRVELGVRIEIVVVSVEAVVGLPLLVEVEDDAAFALPAERLGQ